MFKKSSLAIFIFVSLVFGQSFAFSYKSKQLTILKGHEDIVDSAVLSPDGSKLLSSSYDKTFRIWDVGSAKELKKFDIPLYDITYPWALPKFSWSPTCKQIICIPEYDAVAKSKLLDIKSGKTLLKFEQNALFCNDGQKIIMFFNNSKNYFSNNEKKLVTFDIKSGKKLKEIELSWLTSNDRKAFSTDGKYIVINVNNDLIIYDVLTGREIRKINKVGNFSELVFSPDNSKIVSSKTFGKWDTLFNCIVGAAREITLWDWKSCTAIKKVKIPGWYNSDYKTIFSPDSKKIFFGKYIWDIKSGKLTDLGGFGSLLFSPDGKKVASCFQTSSYVKVNPLSGKEVLVNNSIIKIWDVGSGTELIKFNYDSGWNPTSVAFSADSKKVILAETGTTSSSFVNGKEVLLADGTAKPSFIHGKKIRISEHTFYN